MRRDAKIRDGVRTARRPGDAVGLRVPHEIAKGVHRHSQVQKSPRDRGRAANPPTANRRPFREARALTDRANLRRPLYPAEEGWPEPESLDRCRKAANS